MDQKTEKNDASELSEAGFRKLFDLNPLPMWVFDAYTLAFLAVNEAAIRHYGFAREEFLRMTLLDIRPSHEVARFQKYFQDLSATPQVVRYTGEWVHRKKDGTLITLEVTSQRFSIDGKESVLSVMNDVTERKKAEQLLRDSEDRFRMLSEAAVEGIAIHQDFRIMEVNVSLLRLLGMRNQNEILGRNPLEFVPEELKAFAVKKILEGNNDPYEMELVRSDGNRIVVEVHARSIRYREGTARVVALQDVTERKRAEVELRERESKLAASNRELEQFAYVTSHDLQEPLRMVASYVALLEKNFSDVMDPKARDYVKFAVEGSKRMKQLIDDLLTFSTIGKKQFAPRTVSLNEIVRGVLSDLRLLIEETNATIKVESLPNVMGEPSQLGQVFSNLITNAIKFRGSKSAVITISVRAPLNGDYVISVSDNGIGIDMQYAEKIFRIFQRLHTNDEFPGTGIGLAICKKIVERHQGVIWVEAKPNEGSSFCFSLKPMKGLFQPVNDLQVERITPLPSQIREAFQG